MKRLIVEPYAGNPPMQNIIAILATWGELAELVEQKMNLPQNCDLIWHLQLQRINGDSADWHAYSTVSMTRRANSLHDAIGHHDIIDLPITEVSEVMIYPDGTFIWHSAQKRPADNVNDVEQLVQALSTGKRPPEYCYIKNHFAVSPAEKK